MFTVGQGLNAAKMWATITQHKKSACGVLDLQEANLKKNEEDTEEQ